MQLSLLTDILRKSKGEKWHFNVVWQLQEIVTLTFKQWILKEKKLDQEMKYQIWFDKHNNKIYISIQYIKSHMEEYWGIQENKNKKGRKKVHRSLVSVGVLFSESADTKIHRCSSPLYPCPFLSVHSTNDAYGDCCNSNWDVQEHFERTKSIYMWFILHPPSKASSVDSNGLLFLDFLCV